jgi:hypothetical protein
MSNSSNVSHPVHDANPISGMSAGTTASHNEGRQKALNDQRTNADVIAAGAIG